jgi:uncharacterized protein (TIGR02246 family)
MMKIAVSLICLTLALHAQAVSAAQCATKASDLADIRESGQEWIRLFKGGDIDGLMQLYTPDAQVALHGQKKLVGKEAIRNFFAPALAARPQVEFLLDIETLEVDCNLAHLISKYWYTSRDRSGQVYQDAGRSMLLYRRDDDGNWKILVDMDQAVPDISFPPPATAR